MKLKKPDIKINDIYTYFDANINDLTTVIRHIRKNKPSVMYVMKDTQTTGMVYCFVHTNYSTIAMVDDENVSEHNVHDGLLMMTVHPKALPQFLAPYNMAGVKISSAPMPERDPDDPQINNLKDLVAAAREGGKTEDNDDKPFDTKPSEADRPQPSVQRSEGSRGREALQRAEAMAKQRREGFEKFIYNNTPASIEEELNEHVIGQPELTKAVADFLYYHALRQVHSSLPPRPMLIAGPSGSGKTEVWRAAEKLYGRVFKVKIVDASRLTCEGWKGDYKLSAMIDSELIRGGILVADEFDKLAKPKYSAGGDNVSMDMQSEFLKLMEGEGQVAAKSFNAHQTGAMGFVFVGAFDWLREQQKAKAERKAIGFGSAEAGKYVPCDLDDADYVSAGLLTEIVGRIATKCMTHELTDDDYVKIINNPHSRVSTLRTVFRMHHHDAPEITDDDIRSLVNVSRANKTGVRWVSSQVENILLNSIRECGIKKRDRNRSVFVAEEKEDEGEENFFC